MRDSQASSSGRIHLLDGLRGLAALAVVVFHFLPEPLAALSSRAADVARCGFFGVSVFFVISGFAISQSLSGTRVAGGTVGWFLLRRICRLDPPYWASMVVVYVVAFSSSVVLGHSVEAPSASAVTAHLLYLQYIFGIPSIQDVYWTLCFEIQFYLLLVGLLALKQWIEHRLPERWAFLIVFAPPLLYSVLAAKAMAPVPRGACFEYWYGFFMGVAAQRLVARRDWTAFAMATGAAIAVAFSAATGTATALTGGLIAAGHVLGRLDSWLASAPFQHLGRISYSLYLTHLPVGARAANLVNRALGVNPWARLCVALAGVVFAIVFAHLFWRFVEKPSIALSHRVSRPIARARRTPALS